ncbi:MAG: IS30 family transposase [Paraglaciecola sp.]
MGRFEERDYCAHTAHQQSVQRSSTAKKTSKCHDEVKVLTRSLLLIGLSPEQISGRMGKEKYPHKVSRTTIYSLVARSGWQHLLARKGKTYRKGTKASAGSG